MDSGLGTLLEKRNRCLEKWLRAYESFDPEGELPEESIEQARAEYRQAEDKLREKYPELVKNDGSLRWGFLDSRTAKDAAEKESKRKDLLERILEKQKVYASKLSLMKEAAQEHRKDVTRRRTMSRQYRRGHRDASYLDEKI